MDQTHAVKTDLTLHSVMNLSNDIVKLIGTAKFNAKVVRGVIY